MLSKSLPVRCMLLTVLLGLVAWVPAFGGSAVIGSVAGSRNATIGGQSVVPNTTIFSGDSLQVSDGVAVVAIGGGSRMVFGRETIVSFLRDPDEVTVLLSQGNVSLFHPESGSAVRVKAGDVSIVPARGFKTLGEIAMVGNTIVVTAKEGALRVEGNGSPLEVAQGKTITVAARTPSPSPAKPHVGTVSSSTGWAVAGTAAAVTGAILAGVAISRANNARDAAAAANVTAGQAVSAASASNSSAGAALAAANAATSAANAANSNAIGAGCALNSIAAQFGLTPPSPFIPPAGTKGPC